MAKDEKEVVETEDEKKTKRRVFLGETPDRIASTEFGVNTFTIRFAELRNKIETVMNLRREQWVRYSRHFDESALKSLSECEADLKVAVDKAIVAVNKMLAQIDLFLKTPGVPFPKPKKQ